MFGKDTIRNEQPVSKGNRCLQTARLNFTFHHPGKIDKINCQEIWRTFFNRILQ